MDVLSEELSGERTREYFAWLPVWLGTRWPFWLCRYVAFERFEPDESGWTTGMWVRYRAVPIGRRHSVAP